MEGEVIKRIPKLPRGEYFYLSRKIAFYGVRAEILLTRNQGSLESRVGSVKKY